MTTNPFDQAARYVAKLDPAGFLRWLLPGLAAPWAFRDWLDTRTIPFPGEPDRTCDTVACLGTSEDPAGWWAVPVEFQSEPDAEMFGRLLEFLGRLWREKRPIAERGSRYHVGTAVVNLTGNGHSARDLELLGTSIRTCLQVAERNLATEDAAATLTGIAGGQIARCLLPWVPLMIGGGEASNIEEWKRLAGGEADNWLRGDYGGLALVFAELGGCLSQWKLALEGWNVIVSQQVLEWQTQAAAKQQARAILRLLEFRFPPGAPADLAAMLRTTADLDKLDKWFDAAYHAPSLDDFRRTIQS
jgi:hypothetical protein